MSTYTIRPTSVITNAGGTNPSTQATVLTNLGDNSDVTTVNNTGTKSISWVFGLGNPSVPATEFVVRVGMSLRWKGNAAGKYTIGGQIYRATDAKPAGVAALYPNNSGAFTTTQVGYMSCSWTRTEVSTLRFLWYDGRSSSSWAQTDHADIFGSVYTLALASATPSPTTMTTSVYPVIPVTTTATIDWEASSYDWQNLRKVTTEVRIESGGTGVGTGTLVSTGSQDTMFTATGSVALNVTMPDALANGSYNVYARAIRYRESGTVQSDQYGAWSTAATLTMSTPVPDTPTLSVSADQDADRVQINVTPVATSGYAGPYVFVQRSDDFGITWKSVRGASGIQGTFGTASTFYDYEAPRGLAVQYRAQVQATYSSFINASAWSAAQSTVITADTWNLKSLSNPALNMIDLRVIGRPTEQVQEDLGVFRPLGRRYPVVVAGSLTGWDGELKVTCYGESEWESVKALAESQSILLLESLFGWSKYVRIISGAKSELAGTPTAPQRDLGLAYVEVEQPAIVVGATSTTSAVPTIVDGGTASAVFGDFYDGGTAVSTQPQTIDGGGAA